MRRRYFAAVVHSPPSGFQQTTQHTTVQFRFSLETHFRTTVSGKYALITPPTPYPPLLTTHQHAKQISSNGCVNIVSYDSFAGLRGDRIPPHVKDSREMVDAVAAWALPGTLSHIPADVLLAVVGGLMCEYQVRCAALRCTALRDITYTLVSPPVLQSGSCSYTAVDSCTSSTTHLIKYYCGINSRSISSVAPPPLPPGR